MKMQVIVSMDDLKRIDVQAKKLGLSRSSYCLQAILKDVAEAETADSLHERLQAKYVDMDEIMGLQK